MQANAVTHDSGRHRRDDSAAALSTRHVSVSTAVDSPQQPPADSAKRAAQAAIAARGGVVLASGLREPSPSAAASSSSSRATADVDAAVKAITAIAEDGWTTGAKEREILKIIENFPAGRKGDLLKAIVHADLNSALLWKLDFGADTQYRQFVWSHLRHLESDVIKTLDELGLVGGQGLKSVAQVRRLCGSAVAERLAAHYERQGEFDYMFRHLSAPRPSCKKVDRVKSRSEHRTRLQRSRAGKEERFEDLVSQLPQGPTARKLRRRFRSSIFNVDAAVRAYDYESCVVKATSAELKRLEAEQRKRDPS